MDHYVEENSRIYRLQPLAVEELPEKERTMRDGFVKVATATPAVRVADCAYNAGQCIQAVRQAAELGVRILVLPELCLTGYTCHDLFGQEILRRGAWTAMEQVAAATQGLDMLVFVGLPVARRGRLYNCAAALYGGKCLALIPKTRIPNYGEFYEARHFSPGPDTPERDANGLWFGQGVLFTCPPMPELTVGCEICEDLWAPKQPSVELAMAGATVIVNLSASPAAVGKGEYRRALVAGQSARLVCGYIYACAGAQESTQDLVFSGHSLIGENGTILAEAEQLTESFLVTEIDVLRLTNERVRMGSFSGPDMVRIPVPFAVCPTALTRWVDPRPFVPAGEASRDSRCQEILAIQAAGLAKRLAHTGVNTAVVGLSGGLDSTLALLVMVQAAQRLGWDRKRLWAVTMPGYGTTGRTRTNAEKMALALGVSFQEIPIGQAVAQHFRDIGLPEDDRSVTYENSQARERTQVLMDLANRLGGLVVGTGDLSELALGWATYNGDHMSMYAVNAGVPKTLVRHMVAYVAGQSDPALAGILRDILDTPVSPELLPPKDGEIAQRTEELVGPYDLHDFFLYQVVRLGFSPRKVYRLACRAFAGSFDTGVILHWLKRFYQRFFQQQYKRSCLPDGPKVGSVTLSPRGDWRMPSDAWPSLWLAEVEQLHPDDEFC